MDQFNLILLCNNEGGFKSSDISMTQRLFLLMMVYENFDCFSRYGNSVIPSSQVQILSILLTRLMFKESNTFFFFSSFYLLCKVFLLLIRESRMENQELNVGRSFAYSVYFNKLFSRPRCTFCFYPWRNFGFVILMKKCIHGTNALFFLVWYSCNRGPVWPKFEEDL